MQFFLNLYPFYSPWRNFISLIYVILIFVSFFSKEQFKKRLNCFLQSITKFRKLHQWLRSPGIGVIAETKFNVPSLESNAKFINNAVKSNLTVENNLRLSLNWFLKKMHPLKKDLSAQNFNIITKMVLTLIDQEITSRLGKPSERLLAAL